MKGKRDRARCHVEGTPDIKSYTSEQLSEEVTLLKHLQPAMRRDTDPVANCESSDEASRV